MAAKRIKSLIITFTLLFALIISPISPALEYLNAAPYGACTYSNGKFDQNSTCDETTTGNLSDTGDNQTIFVAIAGLVIGLSGVLLMLRIVLRSKSKDQIFK